MSCKGIFKNTFYKNLCFYHCGTIRVSMILSGKLGDDRRQQTDHDGTRTKAPPHPNHHEKRRRGEKHEPTQPNPRTSLTTKMKINTQHFLTFKRIRESVRQTDAPQSDIGVRWLRVPTAVRNLVNVMTDVVPREQVCKRFSCTIDLPKVFVPLLYTRWAMMCASGHPTCIL